VLSGTGDFLRLLVGDLVTLRLAQIFAYGKWLYPYRMQLHSESDLDQRCLKMCNSKDGCTFPANIFAPTSKITAKPHFGGLINAKPIIQIALRKSHVTGTMKIKLYSYIGIGKYLGCVKIFPQGAYGPPVISETTGARKLKLNTQLDVVKYSLRVQKFFR